MNDLNIFLFLGFLSANAHKRRQEKNLKQKANKEKGVERNRFYTSSRGESWKIIKLTNTNARKENKLLLRKRSCLWLFTILFRRRRFWKLS